MNGLVENKLQLTENEKRFKQPKYFHTDENVLVKDWYKAAYPSDTWGADQIDSNLRFKDIHLEWEDEEDDRVLYIRDNYGSYLNFHDSVVYNRIKMEIDVNDGLSFGYTIED